VGIKEYDSVLLKDGRKGAIVMILKEGEAYEVDFGDYAETVEIDHIEMVL